MRDLRRNSPRMLVLRALETARLYVPIALLYVSTQGRVDGRQAVLWTALFWCYTAARVYGVFADWWTTRYAVDGEGVRLHSGVLVRQETSVRWDEVTSVHVSRPVLHRLLHCSLVRIGTGSQGKQLVLEAVSDTDAAQVAEHSRRSGSARPARPAPAPVQGAPVAPAADDVVYTIGPLDYLLISITYGQFALFVPLCLGAYGEVARWVELPTAALVDLSRGPVSPWTLGLGLLLALALAVGYGCILAWLRYRSFTVSLRDGAFDITGGLISQEKRHVLQSQVTGLKLQQNPLMRVLGHAKLSLVSREPGGKVGTNVVFPVVELQRLARSVDAFFPAHAGMLRPRPHPRRALALLLDAAGLVVLVGVWVLVQALRPGAPLVTAAALVLVYLLLTNRSWTCADVDAEAGTLHVRRGFLWVTQYGLPISSVHVAHLSQGPLGRLADAGGMSLFVYDGRRVRLRVVAAPQDVLERAADAVLADRRRPGRSAPVPVVEAVPLAR